MYLLTVVETEKSKIEVITDSVSGKWFFSNSKVMLSLLHGCEKGPDSSPKLLL